MFKYNDKSTRTTSGVFIVNFEYISHVFLVFLLLTLSKNILAGLMVLKVKTNLFQFALILIYNHSYNDMLNNYPPLYLAHKDLHLFWKVICKQNADSIMITVNTSRNSHWRCLVNKGVPKNFTKFTAKQLCQSLFFNNVVGLRQVW